MPLPAEGVVRAADRWLRLLSKSTADQAWAIIRASADASDLTYTQYAAGLDWLRRTGIVAEGPAGARLSDQTRGLPHAEVAEAVVARTIELVQPPWLADADLVLDPDELPLDVVRLGTCLGVDERRVLRTVRQVHGRIDLELRQEIGSVGERSLVDLLETEWPGASRHIALDHDGYGYDIALTLGQTTWHIEVKSTTRRGRLSIFLSRNEYEVSLTDPTWRLVVLGLAEGDIAAIATADAAHLQETAPRDGLASSWESARFNLVPTHLVSGLAFVGEATRDSRLRGDALGNDGAFAWMPSAGAAPDGLQRQTPAR